MRKKSLVPLFFLTAFLLPALTARAASYDLKEKTPEVSRALENRSARFSQIQSLKSSGSIGENNRGYVEVLNGSVSSRIVTEAENADRKVIYQAIVDQNQIGPSGLVQVEAAFSEVQREKARPGDYVQPPSGDWQQK